MKSAKSAARTACKAAYRRRKIKQWKHKLSNDRANDPNAWTSHGSMDASNAMPVSPVDNEASGLARQAQT